MLHFEANARRINPGRELVPHANNHKGLPPTFATNLRNQGNVIDTGRGNRDLWNLFEYQAALANSEGKFLVILTSAHRSDLSGGCAAFKRPYDTGPKNGDERAEFNVHEQALQLATAIHEDDSIDSNRVRVLSAMTNTDTGAMRFFDPGGEPLFDSESVLRSEVLRDSSDVFEGAFLYHFDKMPQPIHHFLTYMMAANLAHAAHHRNENTRLAKKDVHRDGTRLS